MNRMNEGNLLKRVRSADAINIKNFLKAANRSITVMVALGLLTVPIHAATTSGSGKTSSSGAAQSVAITNAWARATVPGQPVGAVYMTIKSRDNLILVHAETKAARQVQVHSMRLHEGVMQMREQDHLSLAAGSTTELAPGRMHLMLIGLQQPLQAGSTISVTLTFVGKGKRQTTSMISVPVRPIGP